MATVNNISVFAWAEAQGGPVPGIHVAVYDETSGTFYQTGATALANPSGGFISPRCVVLGSKVAVLWKEQSAGKIWLALYDTTAPETVPSPILVSSSAWTSFAGAGSQQFDAIPYNSTTGVVAFISSSADCIAVTFTSAGVIGTPHTFAGIASGAGGLNIIHLQKDTAGNLYYFFGDAAVTSTYYFVTTSSYVSVLAKTLITNTIATPNATSVESFTNQIQFISGALGKATVSSTGIVSAYATIPNTSNLYPATEAVMFDGVPALGVIKSFSNAQPCAWVIDTSGNVLARCLNGNGEDHNGVLQRLPRPASNGTSTGFLFRERGRLSFASIGYDVTPLGLTRETLTPVSAAQLPINRVGDTVYIGGALPRVYDGQQVTDTGFPTGAYSGFGVNRGWCWHWQPQRGILSNLT
jgi:hypothetical protein